MATWDDVRRIALALPETSEGTRWRKPTWFVGDKGFIWERPLSKNDVKQLTELGQHVPGGELLGLRIESVGVRDAIIADDPAIFFTIPHFDGYKAVLVKLPSIPETELSELLIEAWLCRAPKRLAKQWLAEHPGTGPASVG